MIKSDIKLCTQKGYLNSLNSLVHLSPKQVHASYRLQGLEHREVTLYSGTRFVFTYTPNRLFKHLVQ